MIQQIIQAVVNTMDANGDTFSFLHSEAEWQNLVSDEGIFPAVYLDMPVRFTPEINRAGNITNFFSCSALFLYKSNLDDNAEQRYESLTKAMNAQRQFHLKLDRYTDFVKRLEVAECYQAQNLFDANLDAVVMPFKVELHNVQSVCTSAVPSLGSQYEILDAEGKVLYSGAVTLGQTLVQTIQSSRLLNSLGSLLSLIPSEAEAEAPDGTIENSNETYTLAVPSGETVELPDTFYEIEVDGDIEDSFQLPTLEDSIITIELI